MKRTIPLHPFLFALYCVIGVYAQNVTQVPFGWTFRSLLILLVVTVGLYVLLLRRFQDPERAGFVSTLFLAWLFSGHVYRLLLEWSPFWRTALGGGLALLLITAPFGLLASGWIWNKVASKKTITNFLNLVSVVLMVFPTLTIASVLPQESRQIQTLRLRQREAEVPARTSGHLTPDIYVIVVDGYGRADVLQNMYRYENAEFISFLTDKGFYVADRATSNYPQTELSLSSLLNFQYLDEYVTGFGDASGRGPLRELLQHTRFRRFLENAGYQFVALPSAALFAQIRDADNYVRLTPGDINEFEGLLASSSIVGVAVEAWGVDLPVQSYEMHRRYVLFALETLKEIPELAGPKFVFAHILSPHPPFIFDRDGNFAPPDYPYSSWDASLFPGAKERYVLGYTDQMTFINQKLKEAIQAILESSAEPPIILLQGDHGPGAHYDMLKLDDSCLTERYSILSAYYFPDADYGLLYPEITPVNSLRVVLNQYFGANLDLLADKNYFAGWLSPYQFTDVTDKVDLTCDSSAVSSP
jgi:hypothetical protein